ncbi:MAG: right-handed parallel beta-helix repeat-containing protein [Chitinophagaceae bacterium]|nr:right-handed parallel beta-helix repeat-containing protein [Chitinophagaceae bacterium]
MTSLILNIQAQTSYYVSVTGKDTNPGTVRQPIKSIERANKISFKPGDRLLFRANEIFHGNLVLDSSDAGTFAQPVTISSYGSGRATIEAGKGSAVIVENAGGIIVSNLIVKGAGYSISDGSGVCIVNKLPNNRKLSFIRIKNIEASGFGRDIVNNKTQIGEQSPQGHGVFVGGHAIDKSKSGYSDVIIDSCIVFENEFYGILTTGFWQDNPSVYANEKVTIRNCTAHHNHGDPLYMNDHSGSGILMEDVNDGLIEYCTAYENGKNCSNHYGGPCGIWTAVANKVIIQYCESFRNRTNNNTDGDGFDLDGGATNCILQYNYSHDNEGYGYLICSYENSPFTNKNNIVRYNISVNDAQKLKGGAIHFSTNGVGRNEIFDTQVYGNTCYSPGRSGIVFATKGINNPVIINNIFINDSMPFIKGLANSQTAKFISNCYWSEDGKFRVDNFSSIEEWRKGSGQEIYNGKTVGIFADPLLFNYKDGKTINNYKMLKNMSGYRLIKGSPLIDAGINVSDFFNVFSVKADYFEAFVPAGKQFDIGASEFHSKFK